MCFTWPHVGIPVPFSMIPKDETIGTVPDVSGVFNVPSTAAEKSLSLYVPTNLWRVFKDGTEVLFACSTPSERTRMPELRMIAFDKVPSLIITAYLSFNRLTVEKIVPSFGLNGKSATGKKVVVIGGGDVAMDCAATAKLAGAEKVMIYYRRTIEEAPAEIAEIKYVQAMGVTMTTEFAPEEIIKKDGKVYIPALEVRSDDGILSFEGTAGHYEFLR